jgi:hypothetical protein
VRAVAARTRSGAARPRALMRPPRSPRVSAAVIPSSALPSTPAQAVDCTEMRATERDLAAAGERCLPDPRALLQHLQHRGGTTASAPAAVRPLLHVVGHPVEGRRLSRGRRTRRRAGRGTCRWSC